MFIFVKDRLFTDFEIMLIKDIIFIRFTGRLFHKGM